MLHVSIILPTYNRASFLSQAFAAIASQTYTNWELIVVDDGSSDDTAKVVASFAATVQQPVRYIRQANHGPAAARNTGLEFAHGNLIAFYDSDDLWLPHHLANCVSALEHNIDVHWVCTALCKVDEATGAVLDPNTFFDRGSPRLFLRQRTRVAGSLHIVEDPRFVACMLEHGGIGNLQASVFRREVFDRLRLPLHRVGEDQVFMILFLKSGFRFSYLNDVHVLYRVHSGHISAAANGSVEKTVMVYQTLIAAVESLRGLCQFTVAESRALDRRLSQEYFWHLGYNVFWQHGRRNEALMMYYRGIKLWPRDIRAWKTLLFAMARMGFGAIRR